MSLARVAFLLAVLGIAAAAMVWSVRDSATPVDPPRLSYVTTAHQLGVVGYRDPVGAISADGTIVAFSEGRTLYVTLVGGGTRQQIAIAEGQIRHVAPVGASREWIFEDTGGAIRWWIASATTPKRPAFLDNRFPRRADGPSIEVQPNALRQLMPSADGQWIAAVAITPSGPELWKLDAQGRAERLLAGQRLSFPAWMNNADIACTIVVDGRSRLSAPCGSAVVTLVPDIDVIGPIAFSSSGRDVTFASPNERGMVDLWAADLSTRRARRLSSFSRDSYAPSIAADGTVLFKVQDYRTSVVELDLGSGRSTQLSTLQAETPFYHPDGRRVGVTYGTWRRVVDDAKYPDIAQEIGVLPAGPAVTGAGENLLEVIAQSDSEDQAMTWSPNGKWIAFHTHREQSDDIWLRPVDKSQPDRRISFLGRGAEVGWPRWSPDGRWVLYDGASPSTGRSVMFVVGIDQESGQVTSAPREVIVNAFDGDIMHGEWLPDNRTICAIAKVAPGEHALVTVSMNGGAAQVVHRFATEHDFPGHAVSPDGRDAAFVAPGADGFYQIFRVPIAGGAVVQVTTDRTHKTQPAWSPDGGRLVYTVWSYTAQFWRFSQSGSGR